jgi:(p)ppGpp synthase/HD superfamily hydrolase
VPPDDEATTPPSTPLIPGPDRATSGCKEKYVPARERKGLPKPVIGNREAARLGKAVEFAAEKHGRQARKGTRIPYVSHLLHVTALVFEHGGDIDQAIAAVLHDVLEDGEGVKYEHIRKLSGPRVAKLVKSCTDTFEGDTPDQKRPWMERKIRYLEHLAKAPSKAVLISTCDKRHNLGTLIDDVRRDGRTYLDRFNAGPADQVWFYNRFAAVVESKVPPRLAAELRDLARVFACLVEG